ncbi:MAG: methylated-DNA--[protein]-cysteine S-methyltransferase [Verrucomicrobia bacterium]|nr:methylated-DNA--[protein]-cysteine S-methyltransferase [Verrucomicrobiota bacterium]MBS0645685.1 methylated-DNA--[protein]-cysteine S-methyltransferase [Verrucomicrobiota bacterium]
MDECKAGERLGKYLKSRNTTFDLGESAILSSIEIELFQYFQGQLKIFTTPLICVGSLFQKRVWENLLEIPYGQTRSYAEVARKLDKPTAYRAVAQANAANAIAIVIPCHRVINTGGAYGGYASGMEKKIWLLRHEGYI